jgi:DNA-binding NarL/FixJ family response regulator
VARLAPLPLTTAARLHSEEAIATLVDLRFIQQIDEGGRTLLIVSPVHAMAAGRWYPGVAIDRTDQLRSLQRAGYPVGEAAGFLLTHALQSSNDVLTDTDSDLLVAMASVAARLGDTVEGRALLTTLRTRGVRDPVRDAEADLVLLQLLLLDGELDAALDLARTCLEALKVSDRTPSPSALYYICIAVSWARETPPWWIEYADSVTDPAARDAIDVCHCYMGSVADGVDSVEETWRLGMDPDVQVGVRLLALAFLMPALLHADQSDRLEQALTTGLDLLEPMTDDLHRPSHPLDSQATVLFTLSATTVGLLAGFETGRVALLVGRSLDQATNLTRAVGWKAQLCGGYLSGVVRALRADANGSTRDFHAAAAHLRPAFFPLMWLTAVGFQSVIQRWTGRPSRPDNDLLRRSLRSVTPWSARLLGGILDTATAVDPGPALPELPAWVPDFMVHADVCSGRLRPGAGTELLHCCQTAQFPATTAQVRLVEALEADDAEALLSVGNELFTLGHRAAARDALTRARALFIARRSPTRAAVADRVLGAVEHISAAPYFDPHQAGAGAPAAPATDLSPRELEVCRLIAQGLTNVRIAERLVLSVRTVESHVLQARAKLGASKRRDIPSALLAHGLM